MLGKKFFYQPVRLRIVIVLLAPVVNPVRIYCIGAKGVAVGIYAGMKEKVGIFDGFVMLW